MNTHKTLIYWVILSCLHFSPVMLWPSNLCVREVGREREDRRRERQVFAGERLSNSAQGLWGPLAVFKSDFAGLKIQAIVMLVVAGPHWGSSCSAACHIGWALHVSKICAPALWTTSHCPFANTFFFFFFGKIWDHRQYSGLLSLALLRSRPSWCLEDHR